MLFKVPTKFTYEGDYQNFSKFYQAKLERLNNKGENIDLLSTIFEYLGPLHMKMSLMKGVKIMADILFPIFIKQFLYWLPDGSAANHVGYLWAMGMSLVVIVKVFFSLWSDYYVEWCNLVIKNVVRGKIINSVCMISSGAKKRVDVAKITNYLIVDLGKITNYTLFKPYIIFSPLLILGLIILCIIEVSWVVVMMLAVLFVGLGLQGWINFLFKKTNAQRMDTADKRGKKINEIINGIKIIKFCGWEKIIDGLIQDFRAKETNLIKTIFFLQGILVVVSTVMPMLFGITVFTVYDASFETKLSVAQIYSLITLFNNFISPIHYFLMALLNKADSTTAAQRINSLFDLKP